MRLRDPCFKIQDRDLSVLSVPIPSGRPRGRGGGGYARFQVTGMIERIFWGFEIFDFGIFFGRKILASIFGVASFK